jgi:hypothetical protein
MKGIKEFGNKGHQAANKEMKIIPKVDDKFLAWLKTTYTNDKIGEIKAVCGQKHNYLVMTLNFMTPGVLKIDMMS